MTKELMRERHRSLRPGEPEPWHSGVGQYLRDVIFGANDGIITTFALVAGVEGAALPAKTIFVVGLAKVLADAISMGLGNYLATRSETDFYQSELAREKWEIEHLPDVERQEIRDIYAAKGFAGRDLDRAVEIITGDKERWLTVMMREELGFSEDVTGHPVLSGVLTFIAFVAVGILPLLPWLFRLEQTTAMWVSGILTAMGLFAVGAGRSLVTERHWLRAGLEMLSIGSASAALAYGVGYLVGGR